MRPSLAGLGWPLAILAFLFALLAYACTLGGGHPDGGVLALFLYVMTVLPLCSLIGLPLSTIAYRRHPESRKAALVLRLAYGLGIALPLPLYLLLHLRR
jgi:hypothetical protein